MEIFGYNGLQPEHLFYSKAKESLIGKNEVFDIFKRKVNAAEQPVSRSNLSLVNSMNLGTSMINLNSSLAPSDLGPQFAPSSYTFFSLSLVLDKHKHATIL